jgi:hypothetical protein
MRVVRLIAEGRLLFDGPFAYITIGIGLLGHAVER